jgi:hypothetical protein
VSLRTATATRLFSLLATALPAHERGNVITGGWLFTKGNEHIRKPGIVIRSGKFLGVGCYTVYRDCPSRMRRWTTRSIP